MRQLTCESCSDLLLMDEQEFSEKTESAASYNHKWRKKTAAAELPRILCDSCKPRPDLKLEPVVPLDAHPLTNVRRSAFEPIQLDRLPKAKGLNLTPAERREYGVIATVKERGTGQTMSILGYGPSTAALVDVCDRIDWLVGDWKVVSISTPVSIFRDLQGTRDLVDGNVEMGFLSKIGRQDLLDPSLRRRWVSS